MGISASDEKKYLRKRAAGAVAVEKTPVAARICDFFDILTSKIWDDNWKCIFDFLKEKSYVVQLQGV